MHSTKRNSTYLRSVFSMSGDQARTTIGELTPSFSCSNSLGVRMHDNESTPSPCSEMCLPLCGNNDILNGQETAEDTDDPPWGGEDMDTWSDENFSDEDIRMLQNILTG